MPNYFTIYEDKLILGTPEVKGESLEKWALSKGVKPNYASLAMIYVIEGITQGVRGDIAFCQSLVETGWFWKNDTHFDVDPAQNNFGGLGATGGGVPGDSYPTPTIGIRSQLQSLALRCDVKIPINDVLGAYDRKVYDILTNYHHKYWRELAGTWAADKTYWTQIKSMMANFNAWEALQNPTPKPPPTKIVIGIVAATQKGFDVLKSLQAYAPMDFQELYGTGPTPEVPPVPETPPSGDGPLKGRRPFLDVGHGITADQTYDSGALGPNGEHEHRLNIIQAQTAKKYLESLGAKPVIGLYVNKGQGISLEDRGRAAKGCDCFVSCHLNAYNKTAEYSVGFVRTEPSENDRALAVAIATETSKVKNEKNQGAAPWTNYSVLMGAASVGVPACISEACFLDSPGENWPEDAEKFGLAIGKGVEKYLLEH
jgi:N-acetylmuramoyl-L-alanine amidase